MLFKLGEKIAEKQDLLDEFFQEQARDLPPPLLPEL